MKRVNLVASLLFVPPINITYQIRLSRENSNANHNFISLFNNKKIFLAAAKILY
jgi:hypothetical protein